MDLKMTFVDSVKAFDSQLWWALENYNNIWLSSQIYSNDSTVHWGMFAWLQNDRE